jgi:radical SAM superfamily enzyme YgiQ (UPF0313 family)
MNEIKKDYYDIVLVSPPSRMINHYRPPMALVYLAGYLQKMGMKVKIIDVPMKNVIRNEEFYKNIDNELRAIEDQMVSEFQSIETKIVGITFYTPEFFEVFNLAKRFKEHNPGLQVIVGGIHPTFYPEEIFEEKDCPIDFAIIGEGEITLYELTKAILENKNDYSGIKGIAYLDETSNQMIKTQVRPVEDDLDKISFPAYNLIDMEYYANASPYAIRGCFLRSMYVIATRGCPSQCTFCVAKKLRQYNGGGKSTRIRSAEKLIEEIRELKDKYKIDSFYFIDDLFTINRENVIKFCKGLKESKIDILWGCSSKVSTLNEEIIKHMAEAGCIQIDFGVERGSNEALNIVKKGITVEKVEEIFGYCVKYGIRTFANFIINVPGETKKDLVDILKFIKKLNPDIVSINIFTPYPGAEIYDNCEHKFKKEEYPILTNAAGLIYKDPQRLKFSEHNVDFLQFADKYNKKYNKIGTNLKFYLSWRYWKLLLRSKNKLNYIKQFKLLIAEFINQKF